MEFSIKKWAVGLAVVVACAGVSAGFHSCKKNNVPPDPQKTEYEATTELRALVDGNTQLKALLTKAIEKGTTINPDKKTNPVQSLDDYYDFVDWTQHAMPWNVVSFADGADIFKRIDQSLNYFFFINDIPLDELDGKGLYNNSLQYYEPYRSWLKKMAQSWGKYLDTEASWNDEYLRIVEKEDTFGINKGWYEPASNWKTFNQFFARKLKDKGQRPIADAADAAVVASPADACYQGMWAIDDDGYIQHKEGVQIKAKKYSSISELMGPESQYKDAFNGGTLIHSFLNVYDYHRYHFPMAGTVLEQKIIDGDYAVGGSVTWDAARQEYVLDCDTPGWQSIETRGCVVIDTRDYGKVALLPIGMMPVTSINWSDALSVGTVAAKGDELGYFLFGGSDFVILFQKGVKFTASVKEFSHQLMGEKLGVLSNE